MLSSLRSKTLLYLDGIIRTPPPTPNVNPFFLNFLSLFSLKYSTIASDQHFFTVSYLINNFGFSPQTALKASEQVRFETAQKPDSVLAFFRNRGFSNSQVCLIIRKAPWLLSCNLNKTILPKFEFLASKGASSSDIVLLVSRRPRFFYSSLKNNIIPTYELVRRFLQSDKKTIDCIVTCPYFFDNDRVAKNVRVLLGEGVTDSNITRLLRTRPSILLSNSKGLRKVVAQVKELGFDPLKSTFSTAMVAKGAMARPRWDAKVDAFKSWGWSEETILEAFRRQPNCMLASNDKINAVMSFWVNQLGWSSLVPVEMPEIFGYSLQKRIIPRAFVVRYLLAKGLRKKDASLYSPFLLSEESFLEKYVKCFKQERSQLLKLYKEKMNVRDNGEDCIAASGSHRMVNL